MKLYLTELHPYTFSLQVGHLLDEEKSFVALQRILKGIGWAIDPISSTFRGAQIDSFCTDGSGPFKEWTIAEAKDKLDALYRLLKRFNYPAPKA